MAADKKATTKKTAAKKGDSAAATPVFEKKQLTACQDFRGREDLVNALLKDGEAYTKDEAHRLIGEYLKGTVK